MELIKNQQAKVNQNNKNNFQKLTGLHFLFVKIKMPVICYLVYLLIGFVYIISIFKCLHVVIVVAKT